MILAYKEVSLQTHQNHFQMFVLLTNHLHLAMIHDFQSIIAILHATKNIKITIKTCLNNLNN